MKPLNRNHHPNHPYEPRKNAPEKLYRVRKTISRDGSSQEEQMNRKLYIFRVQDKIREKSNRKSTLNSSRSESSAPSPGDAVSKRDPTENPPDSGFNSGTITYDKRKENWKGDLPSIEAVFGVDAMGVAIGAATNAPEQGEKAAAEEATSEALGSSKTQKSYAQIDTRLYDSEDKETLEKVPPPEKKKPIMFKDCVGRKFNFPFALCDTWPV
ncbi:hypothetical protein N7540_005478 [Penicillium herquei]|nr:hypothetical protein N7540_005478 [Penicillium herquei]